MDQTTTETVKYFIIFTRSKLKHWVFRFLDSEIQHVYAMWKSPGGQMWVVLNPASSHTRLELLTVDEYPHPRCYTGENSVIIPVKTTINVLNRRWGPCIFNCVEVVKSLLGVKNFWIFTPYQLLKHLRGQTHG